MTLQQRIEAIVKKISQKPLPQDPDESLFESGVLDSFALPDMVSALETEFSITIPDADLNPRKFDSLTLIATYIETHSA
jgi:acyl carrier protein